MAGLIPFNKRRNALSTGFDDFYNALDDFFSDNWFSNRSLMRDTFKIDVKETEQDYIIEAEVPGARKEQIDLSLNEGYLTISIKKEEINNEESPNYIHRERRLSSMSRSIRLADAKPDGVKAKLENGLLMIKVEKEAKPNNAYKIDIE